MSGVVVLVCVPTELKENELVSNHRVRIISPKRDYQKLRSSCSFGGNESDSKFDEFENITGSLRIPMIKVRYTF